MGLDLWYISGGRFIDVLHMRREWDVANDLVSVFASFFLLSFTKVMYLSVLLLSNQTVLEMQYYHGSLNNSRYMFVVGADQRVVYGSTEQLLFVFVRICHLTSFTSDIVPI